MKPLSLLALVSLFSAFPHPLLGEDKPKGDEIAEEARPERVIQKLPKAITYRKIDATRHEYVISSIYTASEKKGLSDKVADSYLPRIPDALDIKLDFTKRTASFSTKRELSFSELAEAIDEMARLGGDIPYWSELEARDLEATKDFRQLKYSIATETENPPSGLAWFSMPRDRTFSIPLNLFGPDPGSLEVVPTTAYCMCHSKYILRILDPKGKVIWKEENIAFAEVQIALYQAKDSNLHEIRLVRDDHGETRSFVIRGKFVGEDRGE